MPWLIGCSVVQEAPRSSERRYHTVLYPFTEARESTQTTCTWSCVSTAIAGYTLVLPLLIDRGLDHVSPSSDQVKFTPTLEPTRDEYAKYKRPNESVAMTWESNPAVPRAVMFVFEDHVPPWSMLFAIVKLIWFAGTHCWSQATYRVPPGVTTIVGCVSHEFTTPGSTRDGAPHVLPASIDLLT